MTERERKIRPDNAGRFAEVFTPDRDTGDWHWLMTTEETTPSVGDREATRRCVLTKAHPDVCEIELANGRPYKVAAVKR